MRMVPVLLFDEVNGEMGALGHFLGVFDLSQIIKDKQIVNFIIKILSLWSQLNTTLSPYCYKK